MHRIAAIAENTFKESLRQRILILIVIFAVLLIIVSVFMSPFALGESSRIIRDIGLGAAAFFSFLVIVVIGSGLIHKDIEKRTLYTVVTKPVKRSEIILGKFVGLLLLLIILVLGMYCIQQLIILLLEGMFETRLLLSLPFLCLEIMVLISIMLLFSSFSSPGLTSIMAVIFYIIGHASPDIRLFAEQTSTPLFRYIAYAVYYIMPNLENFNVRLELVHDLALPAEQIIFMLCYGLVYVIMLLYLSVILFERKEFK